MKFTSVFFLLVFVSFTGYGQKLFSGTYESGLKLAFDPKTNLISGYYENFTGWDEETNHPKFSCIFYFEGKVSEDSAKIISYFPGSKSEDAIGGTMEFIGSTVVKIKLFEEHGGCWNVQHFADELVQFSLEKSHNWIQVRYVMAQKAHFYGGTSTSKRSKNFVVRNDIVYIDEIKADWAHCIYFGSKIVQGWIKIDELNSL